MKIRPKSAHGARFFLLIAFLAAGTRLAAAAEAGLPGRGGPVTRLERGADLSRIHLAVPIPAAALERVKTAAARLLAHGPLLAVRHAGTLALIPANPAAGAGAALVSLDSSAQTKLVPVTEAAARELQGYAASGDYASVSRALSSAFDGAKSLAPAAAVEGRSGRAAVLPQLQTARPRRSVPKKPVPGLSAASSQPPGPPKDLTLEDVYRITNSRGTQLWEQQWSPDSKYVTYLDQDGNLLAYDWEKKTSETWIKDVGFHSYPQDYSWAPGNTILYAADGNWTLFDPAAKTSKVLGAVSAMYNLKISPDGKSLAYIREQDIWVRPAEGGAERQLTKYRLRADRQPELREEMTAPAQSAVVGDFHWSPDSSRIAYMDFLPPDVKPFPLVDYRPTKGSVKYQTYIMPGDDIWKVSVGVVDMNGRQTAAPLPEDTAYVDQFRWTPNGGLAVEALNRAHNRRTISVDGKAVTVDEDPAFVAESSELNFLQDGSPVYLSEKSGRRHIYAGDRQVTSGEWNVSGIAGIDEKNGWITYTGNEGNTVENHIWRVSLDGKTRERLSAKPGWHQATVSPDGARFIDDWSSVEHSRASEPLQPEASARLGDYGMTPPEFFQIPASDGSPLDAMLIKPRGFSPSKRYPVIVYVYGGAYTQSVQNEWDADFMPWHQMMAQQGFAVLVVDNRLSGAGRTDVMRRMHKRLGAMEVLDLRSGLDWLKKQSWIDAQRIGLWGWSFGGYNTILSMTRLKDIRAGVAVAPVTDWKLYNNRYTELRLGLPQDNPAGYKQSSPVNYAQHLKGRLMVVHGLSDDNVHFQHTDHMITKLDDAGNFSYALRAYPGQRHNISRPADFMNLFGSMTEFFVQNLGGPQKDSEPTWLEKLSSGLKDFLQRLRKPK